MKKNILILLLITFMLAGCSSPSSSPTKKQTTSKETSSYTFNKYSLSTIFQDNITTEEKSLYHDLVDTLYAHGESLKTTFTQQEYDDFCYTFFNNCPLASYLTDYNVEYNDYTLTFHYTCDKEKADQIIYDFQKKVTSIITENVKSSAPDKIIRSIYTYLSKNTSYDSSEQINDLGVNSAHFSYDVIMKKVGFCTTISDAFSYLLSQVDPNIKVYEVDDADGRHRWNVIQMEDKTFYHFDATFQTEFLDGKIKEYYGMSDHIREGTGMAGPYTLAATRYSDTKVPTCPKNISDTLDDVDDEMIGD